MVWPLTIYFVLHSLHSRVEGNWTGPVFPALAIAAAVAAHGVVWRGFPAKVAVWSVRLAAPVGLATAAIVYLQAMFGIIPLGARDPTARQLGAGWPALAAEIDALRMKVGARAVVTSSYPVTSWLSFYLPTRPPVVQIDERIRWINAPPPDPDLFRDPVIYVCHVPCTELSFLAPKFHKISELGRLARTRHGTVIETYGAFKLESPAGDPIDHGSVVVAQ
jgi:hypothetical protein